jgi:(2R)-3-sulfolactate dehydrogenase (NADP+)
MSDPIDRPGQRKGRSRMAIIRRDRLTELCRDALLRAGVDARSAQLLAEATVEAELVGNRAVGVEHLFDYLDAYREGRIVRESRPIVRRAAPAVIDVDACGGLAQTAFAEAFDQLQSATWDAGIAALWARNSFTCGELGYYPRRLAEHGFIAMASANSPALMSLGGAPSPVLGTNPLAYAIPRPEATGRHRPGIVGDRLRQHPACRCRG